MSVKGLSGCRFCVNQGADTCYTISDAFAYEIVLLFIIVLTFLFAWKYLKREFTIIFLMLLGPISCVTYPIDKISDGKAQAYNKWFSEFLYNVLVQPFHLLLYMVLVGSSITLASNNVLYALACLAMLIPAEKFVKEMFGFKDKLGSPLGAMAAGAGASQLLSKMKGGISKSGGNSDKGNEETTPSRIKDKTVDDKAITDGSNDSGDEGTPTVAERNNPELDETDTGGAEALPVGGAENDGDGTSQAISEGDETGDVPTDSGANDASDGNGTGEEQSNNNDADDGDSAQTSKRDLKSKASGVISKLAHRHSTRMAAKWGSTKRSQRWINRGKKAAKLAYKGTKLAAKLAGGVAGAAVGASIGLLSGKGIAAGAAAGFALTGKAFDGIENVAGKAWSTGADYVDALKNDEGKFFSRESKVRAEFKADKNQQNKARLDYMDSHGGLEPSSKELDQLMDDRFDLSRFGLTGATLDDAVESFQALQENNPDMSREQALNQTVLASKLGDRYKGKFEKESDMKGALAALTDRFMEKGGIKDRGVAEAKAIEVLTQASKMKGETIQLPKASPQQVELPPQQIERNASMERLRALGVSEPTEVIVDQEIELHQQLIDNGFTDADIARISSNAGGYDRFSVIARNAIKVKVDYESGGKAKGTIERLTGKGASEVEVKQEIIEIAEIQEMGVEKMDQIEALREMEENLSKGDRGKIEASRNLGRKAIKNGGKLTQKDREKLSVDERALAESYADIEKI